MPDIVPNAELPVNGPPVPTGLLPVQGPPVPPGIVAPPVVSPLIPGQPSQNQPPPAAPLPSDPLAISRQAVGGLASATGDQQKAIEDEAKAQTEKNDADAKAADAAAAEMRKRQEDNDRQQAASEQAHARLVELADKADKAVGSFKFTDYGDTIPVGKKIGLIIGAGLAGLGGQSDPLAQINKSIAQHFETQKAQLSTKEAYAKYKRQGVEDHDKHVNDQRMYMEFQERNYREAIAKEIEARGLRSGNPLVAAKAKKLAADTLATGETKLIDASGKYLQGEEARAHAELYRAKARGAGAGGGAGRAAVEEQLAQAAQDGRPYVELVKIAVKLRVKDPRKAAKEALDGAKEDQSTIVYDPETNKPMGRVPSTRDPKQVASDISSSRSYVGKVEQLAAHIEKYGRILNPLSDEGKMRDSLAADVQSAGRAVAGIQASDAGQKLEHAIIGGAGTGLSTMASPEVLRHLAREAVEKTDTKLRAMLTPVDRSGPGEKAPARAASAAPKVPQAVIDAAKAEVKTNGPHAASARKLLEQQNITVL